MSYRRRFKRMKERCEEENKKEIGRFRKKIISE
jgi:hypothetical protein